MEKVFDVTAAYFLAVIIGVMTIFGVVANGTTIYVIYNAKQLR